MSEKDCRGQELNNVRDNVIFDDALPSLEGLIAKVQSAVNFKPHVLANTPMAFAGIGTQRGAAPSCFNCGGAHRRGSCTQPRAKCDECGPNAGHLAAFCLVINHEREIPPTIDQNSVAKIEKKRAAYKLKMATSGSERAISLHPVLR